MQQSLNFFQPRQSQIKLIPLFCVWFFFSFFLEKLCNIPWYNTISGIHEKSVLNLEIVSEKVQQNSQFFHFWSFKVMAAKRRTFWIHMWVNGHQSLPSLKKGPWNSWWHFCFYIAFGWHSIWRSQVTISNQLVAISVTFQKLATSNSSRI